MTKWLPIPFKKHKAIQLCCILMMILYSLPVIAQEKFSLQGRVEASGSGEPLIGVTIFLPQYNIWTISDINGDFTIKNIPQGTAELKAEYIGMVNFSQSLEIPSAKNDEIVISMKEMDLRLEKVVVTAKRSKVGASTASTISRAAIDHLQATSLTGVMELLPGNAAVNPTLSSPGKIAIRQIQGDALNSLGTSLVVNGSPISNNANLQIGNTAANGELNSDFTSTAGSGVDLRQIPVDNIESVDIIRGIPSVEYGDLTSGVIIVNPKVGEFPLQVRAKINPTLTQTSIGKGFNLGEKLGRLTIDADYAKSLQDERRPYQGYQRVTANLLHSKAFRSNVVATTGVSFISDLDATKLDPSDLKYQRERKSENTSYKFHTNIAWSANKDFFKSLRFNLAVDYTHQKSYHQELEGDFGYMISTATVDGAVTSNASKPVYDVHGNQITNNHEIDPAATTNFLPYEFLTKKSVDGKPLNIFAKLLSTFNAQTAGINHRIVVGADWKTDVNFGDGLVYDPMYPPTPGLRMRPYSSIPALNQLGAFVEENARFDLFGREVNIQAGVRVDAIQPSGEKQDIGFSPRTNFSYDILPNVITLRGGWGVTSKAPTLMYLYPNNAYFDFMNFDNIATTAPASPERLSVVTTKVYNTENPDLEMAVNTKSEVGLDVMLGEISVSLTAYSENLKGGFGFGCDASSFHQFEYIKYYGNNAVGEIPTLTKDSKTNVVLSYQKPLNSKSRENRGVEFDIDFGQIEAIRTSLVFNGAYMQSRSMSENYSYYQKNPDPATGKYKDIGVYDMGDGSQYDRFLTTLRIIHNIPEIGLLFSLSTQTTWLDKHKYLNVDNIHPIGYISASDLSYTALNAGDVIPSDIQKPILASRKIEESYPALWLFNLRLTKEIENYGGFAFFVNNLFMSQPYEESSRTPGNYVQRNPSQFFGVELWVKF